MLKDSDVPGKRSYALQGFDPLASFALVLLYVHASLSDETSLC